MEYAAQLHGVSKHKHRLQQDQVYVWIVELKQPDHIVQQLASFLTVDEMQRANRYHFKRDSRHFIVARGIVRLVLSHYLDCPPAEVQFALGAYGKPSVTMQPNGLDLRFNVSHSHELALIAVTLGREVGVDIEQIRPLDDADLIAEHFFSLSERAVLRSLPAAAKQQGFYACWSRKEAYIKATGLGLTQVLSEFDVTLAPHEPIRLVRVQDKPAEAQHWSYLSLSPPAGYAAALIVAGPPCEVLSWHWHSDSDVTSQP